MNIVAHTLAIIKAHRSNSVGASTASQQLQIPQQNYSHGVAQMTNYESSLPIYLHTSKIAARTKKSTESTGSPRSPNHEQHGATGDNAEGVLKLATHSSSPPVELLPYANPRRI
jgi:hypothetical protein